jgi:hypothetical protein
MSSDLHMTHIVTIDVHDEGIYLVACLHSCTDVTLEKVFL